MARECCWFDFTCWSFADWCLGVVCCAGLCVSLFMVLAGLLCFWPLIWFVVLMLFDCSAFVVC